MRSLTKIFLLLALVCMAGVVPVFSQSSGSTAELRGTVTDSNGAVVPARPHHYRYAQRYSRAPRRIKRSVCFYRRAAE